MNTLYLEDVLSAYFSRLFPYNDLFRWLSYGDEGTFAFREFAFNFSGERYLRNQSYKNIDDLKRDIKKHRPIKIDIGSVYNIQPSCQNKGGAFYPKQKELIFDLDMTDYDDVRICCSGGNICSKCWKFMTIAVKILDLALRDDFGFNNILWSFSGRRGIHCWVCDEKARFLRKDSRHAIANYLQLISGGDYKKKKVEIKHYIHHSVKRALDIIKPIFIELCVEGQNMLGTEERIIKFLGIISEELRMEVKNILYQYETSLKRWEAFVDYFGTQLKLESEKWCKTPFLIEEIMIQYSYPRLDINVSLGMSHLLKSPFSVHPKTGKIGVPIDPKTVESFDPNQVPSIEKLMIEIDVYDNQAKEKGMSIQDLKKIDDVKKTSLFPSLQIFHDFLNNLEIASK